jgi:hypothetical protein
MGLLDRLKTKGTILSPLKGTKPTASLVKDALPLNNTFSKGLYQNYVVDIKVDVKRAQDLTGNP